MDGLGSGWSEGVKMDDPKGLNVDDLRKWTETQFSFLLMDLFSNRLVDCVVFWILFPGFVFQVLISKNSFKK